MWVLSKDETNNILKRNKSDTRKHCMTLVFMGTQRLIKIFFWTVKEWLNEVNGVGREGLTGRFFFRPVQTVKWMFTHQSTSA